MAVAKDAELPKVGKVVSPLVKPPPRARFDEEPLPKSAPAQPQDWRYKYLSPNFARQLSAGASAIAAAVPVTARPGNRSYYQQALVPSLAKNRYGVIRLGLGGDQASNQSVAAHEYTHAMLTNLGKGTPNISSLASPEQKELARQSYGSDFVSAFFWKKSQILNDRGGELAAQMLQNYGGQYRNLPRNARPAYETMFNLATRASAQGTRFDTEGLKLPNWAISLPG